MGNYRDRERDGETERERIDPESLRSIIHTPEESAQAYMEMAKQDRTTGVKFGIDTVDKRMIPMKPGDLALVMGRPGNGKTSTGVHVAKYHARQIQKAGRENSIVIYATAEQSVEEIEMAILAAKGLPVSQLARGESNADALMRRIEDRKQLPLWIMGEAITRRRKHVPLTHENMLDALDYLDVIMGLNVELIVADYAQLFPHSKHHANKSEQVGATTQGFKILGRTMGCPTLLLAQAGRQVDSKEIKIPGLDDGQHSSSLEQDADKVFGVWRPELTNRGGTVEIDGKTYTVDKNLFVLGCSKQRFADAGWYAACSFDPEIVRLTDLEVET